MGIYNTIKSKLKCPNCGNKVEWQSKHLEYDTYAIENLLREIPLNKHMDGEMHAICKKCKVYLKVVIVKGKEGKIETSW